MEVSFCRSNLYVESLWLLSRCVFGLSGKSCQRSAYLPVMTCGVDNPAQSPAVLVFDWENLRCAGGDGTLTDQSRVPNNEQHTDRAAAQGLRAEVFVGRRFFGDPEFRPINGESGDTTAGNAISLNGIEGALVELNRGRPVPHRQRGRYGRADRLMPGVLCHGEKDKAPRHGSASVRSHINWTWNACSFGVAEASF